MLFKMYLVTRLCVCVTCCSVPSCCCNAASAVYSSNKYFQLTKRNFRYPRHSGTLLLIINENFILVHRTVAMGAISGIAIFTQTHVRAWVVYTVGILTAQAITITTFVDVCTRTPITIKTEKTGAFVRTHFVRALSILVAHISFSPTLVNVKAGESVPKEPIATSAVIRAYNIAAKCMLTAIVFLLHAFIDIFARPSIPLKSSKTSAVVEPDGISA